VLSIGDCGPGTDAASEAGAGAQEGGWVCGDVDSGGQYEAGDHGSGRAGSGDRKVRLDGRRVLPRVPLGVQGCNSDRADLSVRGYSVDN
jgi:hypothetical protein